MGASTVPPPHVSLAGHSIPGNGRVALLGQTGSGKSYFARYSLLSQPRLIVCDVKNDMDRKEWRLEEYSIQKWRDLERGKPARLHVFFAQEYEWEAFLGRCISLRNVVIYVDELYGVGPAQGSEALRALYTRGRSLGLPVWGASQRPVFIPRFALSEVSYIALFRLLLEEDQEKMADFMGEVAFTPLYDHQFILFDAATGDSWFYEKLQAKERSLSDGMDTREASKSRGLLGPGGKLARP